MPACPAGQFCLPGQVLLSCELLAIPAAAAAAGLIQKVYNWPSSLNSRMLGRVITPLDPLCILPASVRRIGHPVELVLHAICTWLEFWRLCENIRTNGTATKRSITQRLWHSTSYVMLTFCNSYVLWLLRCVQLRLVTVTFMLRDVTFSSSTVLILYNSSWNYTARAGGTVQSSKLQSQYKSSLPVCSPAAKLGRTPIRDNTLAFCFTGMKYTEHSVAGVLDEPYSQLTPLSWVAVQARHFTQAGTVL
jgi:hypothetical protein